jgi:hypothetical protein
MNGKSETMTKFFSSLSESFDAFKDSLTVALFHKSVGKINIFIWIVTVDKKSGVVSVEIEGMEWQNELLHESNKVVGVWIKICQH